MCACAHAHVHLSQLCLNPCWCLHYLLAFVKLLITFSVSMYICVILCLFSAMGRRVGALQISGIIWTEGPCPNHWQQTFIERGELCRGQQRGHSEGTQGVLGPVRQLFCTFYMDTIWPLHSFWTRLPFKKQRSPCIFVFTGTWYDAYTFFAHVCICHRQLLKT